MVRASYRFALVAFVLTATASILGSGMGDATGLQRERHHLQDNPESEGPTIQISPASENITERNATTFLVYLGNPPWNEHPKYVVLRMWAPDYDTLGLTVNGESPDVSFDQGVGWEFHHDLEPGRHTIYTATIDRESEPGTYSIFATGVFVENGELTSDTVRANLSIEAVPPPPPPSLCERIVGTAIGIGEFVAGTIIRIIKWIRKNPVRALTILLTAIGVLAGVSQLLIALYGKERFLEGVRRPVRRVRGDESRPEERKQDDPE